MCEGGDRPRQDRAGGVSSGLACVQHPSLARLTFAPLLNAPGLPVVVAAFVLDIFPSHTDKQYIFPNIPPPFQSSSVSASPLTNSTTPIRCTHVSDFLRPILHRQLRLGHGRLTFSSANPRSPSRTPSITSDHPHHLRRPADTRARTTTAPLSSEAHASSTLSIPTPSTPTPCASRRSTTTPTPTGPRM